MLVDFATFTSYSVHSFDISELFSNFTVFIIQLTNEFGDPVQLPNDGSSNGYNRSETCLEYFPNIAYSSLKYVKDISSYCSYIKFTSEVDLVNQQIDNMLEDQSFETQVRANVSWYCIVCI